MRILLTVKRNALLLLCIAACGITASGDVKIKAKSTTGGTATEMTTYIKGKRQRVEPNPMMVIITQCDLKRTVELGLPTKTYLITPFEQPNVASAPAKAAPQPGTPARRGGIVTTTMTSTDTGERKQMFGYTARRIKTTMVTESSPDACSQAKSRMETDGWYIDLAFAFDCGNNSGGYAPPAQAGGCRDEYRTKQLGAARTGYPVLLTTTLFDESGKQSFTFTQEVVDISKVTLDAALFEVPADYREVKDRQQMFTASALMTGQSSVATDDAPASKRSEGPVTAGAKRQGVIRIGLPLSQVTATGDNLNPTTLAEAARNTMAASLDSPTVEVVKLDAREPQQIEAEAKQKECDFIVFSDLGHKKGGGGGLGGLLKKAAPIADAVLSGGVAAGTTPSAQSATCAAASAPIKSKDELALDFKLQPTGGAPTLTRALKAKAKSDGEALLCNLVEQAASAVLNEVTRR